MPAEPESADAGSSSHEDFSPNPARAVWIEGELNQELLDRVQPEILALTTDSDEPITVFINSCGGNAAVRHQILTLLSSLRIITVARQNPSDVFGSSFPRYGRHSKTIVAKLVTRSCLTWNAFTRFCTKSCPAKDKSCFGGGSFTGTDSKDLSRLSDEKSSEPFHKAPSISKKPC